MPPTPSGERLAFLDVARGLAALLVVLSHGLQVVLPPGYQTWVNANFDVGRAGVLAFLLISGFIIPASLESGGSLGRFWLRRFFRLWPAYLLSLAVALACLAVGAGDRLGEIGRAGPAAWLANLTMLQGVLGQPHAWGVYWTLSLELAVYAACSLAFACGLLKRVGPSALLAVVAAWAAYAVAVPLMLGRPYELDQYLSLYLAPLIGLVAHRYVAGGVSRGRFYAVLGVVAGLLVVVWAANLAAFPQRTDRMGLKPMLLNWGAPLALFLSLLELRRRAMPVAGSWVGRVSYSVYLFHPFVMLCLAAAGLGGGAYLLGLFGLTLGLSAVTYRWIEEPGVRLGRRVEKWLSPPVRPAERAAAKAA